MKKQLMGILYYIFLPKREIKKSPKIVTIAYSIEKVLKDILVIYFEYCQIWLNTLYG